MSEAYTVMKFGGSSVGNPDRLLKIIETVAVQRIEGPVAIVVSAMGDTTDWLISAMELAARGDLEAAEEVVDRIGDLATTNALVVLRELEDSSRAAKAVAEITPTVRQLLAPLRQILLGVSLLRQATPQSLDLVMSFGERLSATVVTELLNANEVDAFYLDARTWVQTDDTFNQARVKWDVSKRRLEASREQWRDGAVAVCTGFLGETEDGITTTLGRNGSDYTATLLARALQAEEVVICTDVSGVMTADPNIVSDAYSVPHLTYLEALELANYGAKMFHPRTMLPLIESGIPMRIRNTAISDDPGTRITASHLMVGQGPVSVTSLENLAVLDVRWRQLKQQVLMGQRVLAALGRAEVTVWMATQAAHGQAVAVVVPMTQLDRARAAIGKELEIEFERAEVEPLGVTSNVTLLSLVAEKMNEAAGVAGRFFHSLDGVGVNVLAIAQGESSRSISCVIDGEDTEVAVRTVHTAFNFAHQEVNLFLMGRGVVGSQLIEQIQEQREVLLDEHDVALRVVGVSDSRSIVFDPRGLPAEELEHVLDDPARCIENNREALSEILSRLERLSVPVLIDCTAAGGMQPLYQEAFEHGVHVVAANKKPLTGSLEDYFALMSAARKSSRAYHYETTVGASLPVIETLKNLIRTGDQVLRIEGAFSGTLGYLTNEVMRGVPLSEAVRVAKSLGYTEPNPQDDLSGLDVARKALILAREMGLQLSMEDVHVEPLVSRAILETPDLETFFAALEHGDVEFMAGIEAMKSEQKTLRYLAIIDPGVDGNGASLEVGPVAIPQEHPATRLRGSEAFVAFTTARYQDYPLIVQGAGAGGAVTAAGVLADALRISQNLRGR